MSLPNGCLLKDEQQEATAVANSEAQFAVDKLPPIKRRRGRPPKVKNYQNLFKNVGQPMVKPERLGPRLSPCAETFPSSFVEPSNNRATYVGLESGKQCQRSITKRKRGRPKVSRLAEHIQPSISKPTGAKRKRGRPRIFKPAEKCKLESYGRVIEVMKQKRGRPKKNKPARVIAASPGRENTNLQSKCLIARVEIEKSSLPHVFQISQVK